jgi:CRISPR-associated protein Cas2
VRRRYVVAYDIRDEVRLRQVHGIVSSFGERLQYSVFLCDLTISEKIALKTELRPVLNHHRDSIVLIDLGEATARGSSCFEFMGTSLPLPTDGPTIV